ncbi:MAG: hypothetical protein CMJ64_11180 [Planctomycetaceae bacterium]|nr:hypothetical protein [Planctomycetaceae bacterium]
MSDGAAEGDLRGTFAKLYRLVVQMVGSTSVRALSETVLDALLESVNGDIGAVLLFPHDAEDRTAPGDLRIISYRAPDDMSYQKVSRKLSRLALSESEAILGLDISQPSGESEFQTLSDMHAQSVICAPVRYGDMILGFTASVLDGFVEDSGCGRAGVHAGRCRSIRHHIGCT